MRNYTSRQLSEKNDAPGAKTSPTPMNNYRRARRARERRDPEHLGVLDSSRSRACKKRSYRLFAGGRARRSLRGRAGWCGGFKPNRRWLWPRFGEIGGFTFSISLSSHKAHSCLLVYCLYVTEALMSQAGAAAADAPPPAPPRRRGPRSRSCSISPSGWLAKSLASASRT